MNRLSNILPAVLIWLGYLIYFLADFQSSEFVYAANSTFTIEEFDSLAHFSFEHFIAPWRYRIVPRLLQWWLFAALRLIVGITYLQVALGLSAGFAATALATFYFLLRKLGSGVPWSMIGCALAMGSFPLLFGYRLRNWMTLDDALSYFLLIVGLLLVLFNTSRRGRILFMVVSVLAVLTRETTLLLSVVVLFDRRRSVTERIVMATPALVAFLGVRLLLFETSEVTTTVGFPVLRLDLNLAEEGIVLTSAYTFAVFGVGWLLAAFGWVHFWRKRNELTDSIWLFWITTLIATMMLGGFNLLIGSIRENRIWFLAFPWVIGLGTLYLHEHWRNLLTTRNVRNVALVAIVFIVPVILFLLLVPGGGDGARLETLQRIPGLTFVYESIWLQFSYRFNYIPGQFEHVLVQLALTGLLLVWQFVAYRTNRTI